MRRLTPEEIRRRNKAVMFDLIPIRLLMAGGTFIMALRDKRGLCGAYKEARSAWKLRIA